MEHTAEFEKPIIVIEKKLADLRELAKEGKVDFKKEIQSLEKKLATITKEIYEQLTPWQRVLVARHPNRPYSLDYIQNLFIDFEELHGDRNFADDSAVVAGTALYDLGKKKGKIPVMIIAQQKGRTTKQKAERNFGMAKPEGYRKAVRLMDLANRMGMPIITLIDTPGAYPGLDAEDRGQAQAIAESIVKMFELKVPVIAIVIGEGGSGGALAFGVADRVLMLEHSIYSVISPESCASILWNDSTLAEKAAEKLKMNSGELLKFKVIDEIIPEPLGGAHRNWDECFKNVRESLQKNLQKLVKDIGTKKSKNREKRIQKFRDMGNFALSEKGTET